MDDLSNSVIFPRGGKLPGEFSKNFTGQAYLEMLSGGGDGFNCPIGNVTFEPGCRNNWHRHPGGQILLVTGGRGWYREEGKPAQSLKPGDVVVIPPNVKHWHGAKADCWFSHIAIEVPGEATGSEWCESVSDEEYGRL